MARAGQVLFNHQWYRNDPLAANGDGLGPVFNDRSCVACHHQGGEGGSGGVKHNVTVFTVRSATPDKPQREGVIHKDAISPKFMETLSLVDATLPAISRVPLNQLVALRGDSRHCLPMPRAVDVSQRNTPALFGAKLIDAIPESVLLAQERSEQRWGLATSNDETRPVGRARRLPNGRLGRFGWKAQTESLSAFVQAACANELGLGNPGQAQPRPLGVSEYVPPGLDLTQEQCDQLTAFCGSLPRPVERWPDDPAAREQAEAGRKLFISVGCAECHTPNLGSVEGLYSDLLLHRMGADLVGGGSYDDRRIPPNDSPVVDGAQPGEWRTPPLWGVADSAPYLHDGRATTFNEAIVLHGGQGLRSAERFRKLVPAEQAQLMAFLATLQAP
jgi:CxxC motif-containing protein (DUF1111 family)